jgi:hypothetical protein
VRCMVSSGASRLNPQNIYDNPGFFAQYRALRRSGSGLNAALEWPALLRLLPPSLEGRRVLDILNRAHRCDPVAHGDGMVIETGLWHWQHEVVDGAPMQAHLHPSTVALHRGDRAG